MVSAPLVAKSAGIKAINTAGDEDMITVVTSGEGGKVSMTGIVCGNKAFLTGKIIVGYQATCVIISPSLQW